MIVEVLIKLISLYVIRDVLEVNLIKNPLPLGMGVSDRHKGGELDQKVKMIFQNKLEEKLLRHYITYDEVKEILDISDTATHKLLDGLVRYKEGYEREELISACMGEYKQFNTE